jgi:hemin uptake protein HemP
VDEQSSSSPIEKAAEPREESRVLRSEELFARQRVLLIEHAGQRYRLLITRNERLILQK